MKTVAERSFLVPTCPTRPAADWANPMAWYIRGLVVNEFESPDWDKPSPVPGLTLGQFAMAERCAGA